MNIAIELCVEKIWNALQPYIASVTPLGGRRRLFINENIRDEFGDFYEKLFFKPI